MVSPPAVASVQLPLVVVKAVPPTVVPPPMAGLVPHTGAGSKLTAKVLAEAAAATALPAKSLTEPPLMPMV
jgi:hypothetical protein